MFTVFSWFLLILVYIQISGAAAQIDNKTLDGEKYVQKIVHGQKVPQKPELLVFTAPYKLCEGCNENAYDNFEMKFPLYIGQYARKAYMQKYERDPIKLSDQNYNAPFRKKTTKWRPTTRPDATSTVTMTVTISASTDKPVTCPTLTLPQTTTTPPPLTLSPLLCPYFPPGVCLQPLNYISHVLMNEPASY